MKLLAMQSEQEGNGLAKQFMCGTLTNAEYTKSALSSEELQRHATGDCPGPMLLTSMVHV